MQQQQHYRSTAMPVSGLPGTAESQAQQAPLERELPGLVGLGSVIRWIEELISLLSGPLLTIGLAIALIDLLTGGDLLRTIPMLLFAWGICQAVGIDSQLVATFDKLRRALRERRWWVAVGLLLLGVMLGYVGFLSAEAFGFQHAFAVTEAQALQRLGIDPISWQFQRAALAVFLVMLSGFTRYHPPAKNYGAKAASEAERLQAEIKLEPMRAQLRAAKLRGVRTAGAALLGREGHEQPSPSKAAARIYAASATIPEPVPQEHHGVITNNKRMHDADEWAMYGIPDEAEEEETTYSTRSLPEFRESQASQPQRRRAVSGTRARESFAVEPLPEDEDEEYYDTTSRHQRKKGKTAAGRMNQRQRTQILARQRLEREEANERDRAINAALHAVMVETNETGEELSGYQLEDRVNEYLQRSGSTVRTSRKTAEKKKALWLAQRAPKTTSQPIPSLEPDELRELQEVGW